MNRFAYTRLLIALSCALGFAAATPAEELNPAERGPRLSADPQIAALEQSLTNAAHQMAQARLAAPAPPPEPVVIDTGVSLAGALLVVMALAALMFGPRLKRRFGSWIPKPHDPADLALSLLEEPSIAAFFESLRAGPTAPAGGTVVVANPLREFYDSASRQLAELQKLFSEIGRAPGEAARRERLQESFEQVGKLRERAGLPELLPIWQVTFALEELLKQLLRKASEVTPSVLRTIAGALDLLRELCNRRARPDLATEPPVRLLAVDDDPICRRALSFALAKAFREPDLAPDGEAALALAARHSYDAIFLDVEMPGMSGFELCSSLHETELNHATPVVFVTRHDGLESRTRSTLLGAHGFIAKPFLVFEITVKALTMVMRARLDHGAADPAPAPKPEAASEAPAMRASAAAAASETAELPGQPGLSETGKSADGVAPALAPASFASASVEAAALRQPDPGALSSPSQPARQELAQAFFKHATAQIEALRQQLASAREASSGGLKEILGDLYLDAHRLRSDAGRAELDAALRLAAALEGMLKKLFDCPKLCAPSTLDAAAGALDVLDELCRARTDPDLAQPPVRLMVVDDDPVAGRAIAVSLQLVFGRPDSADSGEAALALAGKRGYDLIFLDVRMPGLDGFATCTQIHATAMNRRTPVVFVTSAGDAASRAQAAESGGCGFIPKPVLASQITLVALSYILHGRLGWDIPALDAPPSLVAGSDPEPASPELAGQAHAPLASPVGVAN
jgi:DNA-binding response OmpR family regulator